MTTLADRIRDSNHRIATAMNRAKLRKARMMVAGNIFQEALLAVIPYAPEPLFSILKTQASAFWSEIVDLTEAYGDLGDAVREAGALYIEALEKVGEK